MLHSTKSLYTEHSFGEFDYNRDKYYEKMLCTEYAKKMRGGIIYDIGCGRGYVIGFLSQRNPHVRIRGVDLSPAAVKYCRSRGYDVKQGNNLALTIPNNTSDFTISNGVIHHTPDAKQSFSELVRITKPGSPIYVSVYRLWFPYSAMYWGTAPIRWLYDRGKKSKRFVERFVFPIFYWCYFVPVFYALERKRIGKQTGMTLFADQFLTPQATFHTKRQLARWAKEYNCVIEKVALEKAGQMISVIVRKKR